MSEAGFRTIKEALIEKLGKKGYGQLLDRLGKVVKK